MTQWLTRWWRAPLAVLLGLAMLMSMAQAREGSAPGHVVLLSTYVVSPARLARLVDAAGQAGVPLQTVSAESDTPQALQDALRGARLLVVDAPHGSVVDSTVARFGDAIVKSATPYVVVGEFGRVAKNQPEAAAPLLAAQGVSAAWAQRLREYWRFGGAQNMQSAMAALDAGAGQGAEALARLPPAVQLPPTGFYHPNWPRIEGGILALQNLPVDKENNPLALVRPAQSAMKTVAIAVNNAVFASDDTGWLDTLIAALAQRGLRAYAFYGPRQQKDLFFQATHQPTPAGPSQPAIVRNADAPG